MENLVNMIQYKELTELYKGKKVLLTGHTGFKGSWMLLWLHQLQCQVKGVALDPIHDKDLYHLIHGDELCESVILDIRNKEEVYQEIANFQPDVVFHLAAQPLVLDSYNDPIYTYETNVMGTAHVLEGVRQLKNRCDVVVITTDKVYENIEQDIAYKESDRLNGFDPYSNSKACCELVCDSYRNSFFNPADYGVKHQTTLATTRSGNVIGGGDWSENRIIPDTAKALMNDWPLVLRNPNAIRPWQHVLDPIYGYLLLGANLIKETTKFNGAYNFGPEYEDRLTVGELAEEAVRVWGSGTISNEDEKNKPHEAGLLMLDSTKAKNELGWKPGFNSKSAVSYTMQWYKSYSADPKGFTLSQVNEYIKNI